MPEESAAAYLRLFDIRLLHHYWLDNGGTVFDLTPEKGRQKRLLSYDVRPILDIEPTPAASKLLTSRGCLFKKTALGCVVAAPAEGVMPVDTLLEFAVTVRDPAFYQYTALTLPPRQIREIVSAEDGKVYRYKENVPLLSSLTGGSRTLSGESALFLSAPYREQGAEDRVESLVVAGGALRQLWSDPPGAKTVEIGADADALPVFLHQGDVPAIVPPAGVSGAPARGVLLAGGIPDAVFAVIRIAARRADDDRFSFLDAGGHPKQEGPVFQLRFKNRSTVWRYRDKKTGEVVADPGPPAGPLPLTRFGSAGSDKRPKPSAGQLKIEGNGAITQLVSEVFL